MAGYLPLSRKFFEHSFWTQKRVFSRAEAWIDLLAMAQWEPGNRLIGATIVALDRGELVASVRFLASRWGWPKSSVARFISVLQKEQMLVRKPGQIEGHLTICNYATYNPIRDTSGTELGHEWDSNGTRVGQRKEGKELNKGINIPPLPPRGEVPAQVAWTPANGWEGITDEMRERWAEAYPACNIQRQLNSMAEWLHSNPTKAHKSNWLRFITNWLSKQQDRGGDQRPAFGRAKGNRQLKETTDADHSRDFFAGTDL